jgi:hypothetical protein
VTHHPVGPERAVLVPAQHAAAEQGLFVMVRI